jgi:hypothetical protein
MLKSLVVVALFSLIAGCVTAPTRSDVDAFELLQEGRVETANVLLFKDCLMDGFSKAHYIFQNIAVRQERRASGYRIETVLNATLLVSADISDAGLVQIYESSAAALIITKGERESFSTCLKQYGEIEAAEVWPSRPGDA